MFTCTILKLGKPISLITASEIPIVVFKCTPKEKFKNILKNQFTEKINNTHITVELMNHGEMKTR